METGVLLTGTTPWLVNLALLVGRGFIGVCFIIHALGKLGLVGTGNMRAISSPMTRRAASTRSTSR